MQWKENSLSSALVLTVGAGLAVLAGLSLSRGLAGTGQTLKPTPFGPEIGFKAAHHQDFSAAKFLRQAGAGTRVRWEELVQILPEERDSEHLAGIEEALIALRKENPDFPPLLWIEALVQADSVLLFNSPPPAMEQTPLRALEKAGHPFGLYAAGALAEAMGDTARAVLLWSKASEAAPDFAYPWKRLGKVYLLGDQPAKARQALQLAIGLMENDPDLYRLNAALPADEQRDMPKVETAPYGPLAELFLTLGHADTAAQALQYAREKNWRDADWVLAHAWLTEWKGDLAKARQLYDSVLADRPGSAEAEMRRLSLGLKGSGDKDGEKALFAIEILDPLVKAYPKDAPLRLALAKAYIQRGLSGLALQQLDTGLALSGELTGARELRQTVFARWMSEEAKAEFPAPKAHADPALELEGEDRVVIPGSIGLLGTYTVPWGASSAQVRQAYAEKRFLATPGGDLTDRFSHLSLSHENLLAFSGDSLWGILAVVSDTAGGGIDVFGRMIRVKTKISGEGRGTGEVTCPGYRSFQGAIWENDDTFEFMAQFQGKESQVRLARIANTALPDDRRLCSLLPFLDKDSWTMPPNRREAEKTAKLAKAGRANQSDKPVKAKKPAAPEKRPAGSKVYPTEQGKIIITPSESSRDPYDLGVLGEAGSP